jgi:hypothetical protein
MTPLLCIKHDHQPTIYDFGPCMFDNPGVWGDINPQLEYWLPIQVKWLQQHHCFVLNMSVNEALRMSGLASCLINELCDNINSYLNYRPPLEAKCFWWHHNFTLKMIGNGAWMILDLPSSKSIGYVTTCIHICTIGCVSWERSLWGQHNDVINWVSTERQPSVNGSWTELQQCLILHHW